jgi:NADPH-dependent 2,4-dienoyl-CoA reductase/sulfur reductase-like enzyme
MTERFDLLVVGAGPAGIAAAVTAAECGLRVVLVDDNPASGGQIWRSGTRLPKSGRQWVRRLGACGAVNMQGWRIFDIPERGMARAERVCGDGVQEDRLADLHYGKLILATGARERFLPFPGWTLANVMGAGGLDAMIRGGLPIAGKRVVVAGTGPLLLAVAAHVTERGAQVMVICEQASTRQMLPLLLHTLQQPGKLWQGVRYGWAARQSRYLTSCRPIAVLGEGELRAVVLQRGDKRWRVDCDYLACGFHLVPNTELAMLLGCRIEDGFVSTSVLMETSVPGVWCAGEPTGIGGVELSLLEGQLAGLAASGRTEDARTLAAKRIKGLSFVQALQKACRLDPQLRNAATEDTIVCRCEDVRMEALRNRANWRDAKLHTRCGMGPCQGRVCGGAVEFLFGWRADSVRPPVFPALVQHLSGPAAAVTTHQDSKESL